MRVTTSDKPAFRVNVVVRALLVCVALLPISARGELPGPGPNLELIPAGSLIIAMDNDKQNIGATFNLSAYGLANHLLWQGVRVKWAIRAGKTKDGIDFTVAAQRVQPTPTAPTTLGFRGGPFIVHRDDAAYALPRIIAFGRNVAVYETTADVMVDVRFTLDERKKIGVLDDGGNADIHTEVLDAAGFVGGQQYQVIPAATLITVNADACFTMVGEPHWDTTDNDDETDAVRQFVESGGNFLAQCASIESYENNTTHGLFQSTLGMQENNLDSTSFSFSNADLAYSQFHGNIADGGGSIGDYELSAGSSFANSGHVHVRNTSDPSRFVATASKLAGGDGANVFYLGSHRYNDNNLENLNGRRMYLNAAMMPSDRPGSCGFTVPPVDISGTVYEDVNGDSALGDAVAVPDVLVRLYQDANDNGVVDAGDVFVAETTTGVAGSYLFSVAAVSTKFLVVVDSQTVGRPGGYNGGADIDDVWPEQTYGDNPASPALDLGPRFGGVAGAIADDVDPVSRDPADNVYEHVARVDVTGGNVSGVDFAFSFNVVVNVNGAGQGSLLQFIGNANDLAGANLMRFVPAVPANAYGAGGSWWQLTTSTGLPAIDDALTTIDGTAYSASNGTSIRNDNLAALGRGGSVGLDNLPLVRLDPEFEVIGVGDPDTGFNVEAANVTIRHMAVYGFGDRARNNGKANIRVGNVTGTTIEYNVIGASAASFTDPGSGAVGDNVRIDEGDSGTIRNNLIGFSGGNGIGVEDDSDNWLIVGNEIRGNGTDKEEAGAVDLEKSGNSIVRGNLLIDNFGEGVDTKNSKGGHTIENNEISGNGVGDKETAGVRLQGNTNLVRRNEIHTNFGAGIMVDKDSQSNVLSQNNIYDNGEIGGGSGQIGIDLQSQGDNDKKGTAPFVTVNDNGDADAGGNGLLNYPVIDTVSIVAGNLVITGWARPGSLIEFFAADEDPSGFGEGGLYLVSLTEGSVADFDGTVSGYGPGAVNGIAQGQDTTNRFRFEIPPPVGVTGGIRFTATATLGGQTSEFSGLSLPLDAEPSLMVLKAQQPLEDPVNGTADPRAIPQATMRYLVSVNNSGLGLVDDGSMFVTDAIPAATSLVVADFDGSNPGPVAFIDGATSSGLSYTFIDLASDFDDIEFSNDNMASWTYDPVDIGNGTDPAVTHIRVNPKGIMQGIAGGSAPSFQLLFKVLVD